MPKPSGIIFDNYKGTRTLTFVFEEEEVSLHHPLSLPVVLYQEELQVLLKHHRQPPQLALGHMQLMLSQIVGGIGRHTSEAC